MENYAESLQCAAMLLGASKISTKTVARFDWADTAAANTTRDNTNNKNNTRNNTNNKNNAHNNSKNKNTTRKETKSQKKSRWKKISAAVNIANTPVEIDVSGLPDIGTKGPGNKNTQAVMTRFTMEFPANSWFSGKFKSLVQVGDHRQITAVFGTVFHSTCRNY